MFWETILGETPIDDLSELKIKGITLRRELNEHEAENIRKAVVKYFVTVPSRKLASFTITWAKKLHEEMFGEVWEWAGAFRLRDLSIGVKWEHVETSLHDLLENMKYWDKTGDLVEQSAWLHHRAVQIHPFVNGNGRWSRMLTNIWLAQNGKPYIRWPEKSVGDKSVIRDEYIHAVKKGDAGDFGPLIELHRNYQN